MEIISCSLFRAKTELEKPIADSTHKLTEISFLVLRIHTSAGITGESHLLGFQYSPHAIEGALMDHAEAAVGMTLPNIGTSMQIFRKMDEYFGNEGVHRWAQSAFSVAMWDAWCKKLGEPIWKVLGSYSKRVPLYGSGGWISYTLEELLDEVRKYRELGFRGIKIKVGSEDWREDLERLKRVRSEAGKEMDLMMDANQGMELRTAVQLGAAAEDLGVRWFEEPFPNRNFDGYRSLKEGTGIPLAMGEREFSDLALRELLDRRAIDVWQPDIMRIGGVESWRQSAILADRSRIPVFPHFYKEFDVPLLCTIPNGKAAEYFDWIHSLIDHPLRIENGMAIPHDRPGWGFGFKDAVLTEV